MAKTLNIKDIRNRVIELKMLKPRELLDHPGQFREHNDYQVGAMIGALNEVGQTDALKAWYSERAGGQLVTWDGHLRKSLNPDLPWPVLITDLTDAEADYALATHDPLAAMAGTDAAALDSLLHAMSSQDEDVQKMLAAMAVDAGLYLGEPKAGQGGDDFDATPVEGETRCKRGDLWQLGEHRLLVDDCTVDENIARLLGTEKAQAVVTDPPYAFGLSSTSALSSKSGGWHDMMNNASWFKDRYNQWRQMVERGPLWVFCNWRTLPILMRASFDSKVGIESVMVWYKDWIGPGGMRGLRPTYEFIALSVLGDYGLVDRGIEDFYTAKWSSHKPTGHQAEKPVDLLIHLLAISHCPNIFDPFCGSGTMLVAAHRLGYRCFGAEVSESWADVILRRFTAETGLEPELISRE